MADTDTAAQDDPAAIEQDIRRTQEEMSRTVDRIGDQLTPRSLMNALLDQAESNNLDARALLDGARRNPLALAMIAGGAIWLASDHDAKLPSHAPKMPGRHGRDHHEDHDTHHRDYISHMERVDWREGEDPASYQRRRDIARANYFMVERGHEEDEGSFRKRLDDAAEAFRAKRRAWSEQTHRAAASAGRAGSSVGASVSRAGASVGASVADTGRAAIHSSRDLFDSNPLIGGLAAAAVGALLGSIVPITETEEQQLGGLGRQARDLADEQKDRLVEAASEQKDKLAGAVREQKDHLVSSLEQKVQAAPQPAGAGAQQGAPQPRSQSQPQPAYQAQEPQGQAQPVQAQPDGRTQPVIPPT